VPANAPTAALEWVVHANTKAGMLGASACRRCAADDRIEDNEYINSRDTILLFFRAPC